MNKPILLTLIVGVLSCSLLSAAEAPAEKSLAQIKQELEKAKQEYADKLKHLEQRLEELEQTSEETQENLQQLQVDVSQQGNQKAANTFNPGIGMVLNGRFVSAPDNFEYQLPGLFSADEIGPGENGLQLGESELNMSANVDDKFYASTTIAFGEGSEVEEAYLQTIDLGNGFNVKFGRFFSGIGYLTSKHAHTDDFSSRPLPYEAFLGGQYGDDGVQASWIAPTTLFWESGIELFRGENFPAAGAAKSGKGAWTVFTHVGGDIGESSSWRAGLSLLNASVADRQNDNGEAFNGDSKLWIADFVYKWSPAGNRADEELILQGEYLSRKEDGIFNALDPLDGSANYSANDNGWYLNGVYRMSRQWRLGIRTSALHASLDALNFNVANSLPDSSQTVRQHSLMLDWSNSEFSRIRLQFDNNQLSEGSDNVWILQYIAAFGAHGAHSF